MSAPKPRLATNTPETVPQEVDFQAIAEYTVDWETWFGRDGKPRWINPAVERITGYQVQECLKMPDYPIPIVHENDQELVRGHLENALNEKLDLDIEFRLKCKSDAICWASLSYQPVYDRDETLIGTRWSVRDINSKKKDENRVKMAKTEAELANRAKTELVTNMSHELRTPLNAIIGFSQAMKQETFGDLNEKYLDYISCIQASGEHLLELINDILDVAAIEAGKMELHYSEVNIGMLMEASLRLIRPRAEEAGVQISNEIGMDMPLFMVDERRIKQVFLNILSNAVKFTEANGEVHISAWYQEDTGLEINIADTGIGMDEEGMEKAMSIFGQADSQLARKYEGTGLGLPLSRNLVEMHKGALELKSQKGVGTFVTVRLPTSKVVHS